MAKRKVIEIALDVLSNRQSLAVLAKAIEKNNDWNSVSIPGMKSRLENYVQKIFTLARPPAPIPETGDEGPDV